MSNKQSLPIDKNAKREKLPQKIPITYLWFGKEVPEDYLISLSQLKYPVNFLKDPLIERKFSREIMDIEKSDYYRLQYLYEHGGIYSDFDNIIDYPCLMKLIEPYRNQDKLVFMTDGKHTRQKMKEMTNNLIFAPYPNMPILKKMLDQIDEKKGRIWGFAGMKYVAKFTQPLEVDMRRCVKHTGDWSWFSASNSVLKKSTDPHGQYAKKLLKKREIEKQNSRLGSQVQNLQINIRNIRNNYSKVNDTNIKLNEEIKKLQQKISKQSSQIAKQNVPIKTIKAQPKHNLKVTNNPDEQGWTKQKVIIQSQVEQLATRNNHLQFQRDIGTLAIGGSLIIIIIILIVFGARKLGIKKRQQFNYIENNERSGLDQNKLDQS